MSWFYFFVCVLFVSVYFGGSFGEICALHGYDNKTLNFELSILPHKYGVQKTKLALWNEFSSRGI